MNINWPCKPLFNWGPKMLTQFKQLLSKTRNIKCKNRESFLCFLDRNWVSTASFSRNFSMILNCWINSNSCWAQQETTNAERVRLFIFFCLFVLPTTAIEETLFRFHEFFVFCIELLPNLLLLPSKGRLYSEWIYEWGHHFFQNPNQKLQIFLPWKFVRNTVGNPVANSHPCMLLGRINSWLCKKS